LVCHELTPGKRGGVSDARRGVKERGTSCATPWGVAG
jgi:hypothetical protein